MADCDEEWGAAPSGPVAAPPPPCYEDRGGDSYQNEEQDSMSVPTKDLGLIIGRGGSRIRELEQEFGVKIHIDRQAGDVCVTGGQVQSFRQACLTKISSILHERPGSGMVRRNGFQPSNGGYPDQGQQGESMTISIASQDIGLIIGRGGSKIQEIERNSGARVRLNKDALQVIITGSENARQTAVDLIKRTCDRRPVPNDYSSRQPPVKNNYSNTSGWDENDEWGTGGGGYKEPSRQPAPPVKVYSNTSSALVESGWDDDEDWGAGSGSTSNNNQYVPQQQQPSYHQPQQSQQQSWDRPSYNSYDRPSYNSYDRGSYSNRPSNNNSYNSNRNSYNHNQFSSSYHSRPPQQPQPQWGGGWQGENDDEEEDNYGGSKPAPKPPVNDAPIDWEACLKQSEEISNKRWAHLPPVIKNFYHEDPEVAALLPEEVEEFRKAQNNIMLSNLDSDSQDPLPNPVMKFEQAFGNYPDIMAEIHKNKFVTPSPVQCQAWPLLLSGRDTIAIAQTGTGKTLAFLLPAFIHIEGQVTPREKRTGPSVICMCPTRELAQQIYTEVLKYNYHGIKAACIYGGKGRKEQIDLCQRGVEIIIATPGRLNDLIQNGFISLESVTYLILDEADRMLDMGFEPDIRKVLIDIRPDRQSVMTSATWPPGVRKMASRYLKNAAQIYVGSLDLNAVHTVRQELRFVSDEEKRAVLFNFIAEMGEHDKILVFCGRKSTCSDVASELSRNDIPCESIHGDREQQDREDALADFKNSAIRILIATDVASRGLDIHDITHVVNFDFPKDMEEYVHRIGRTGRFGRKGVSVSFFTRQDWSKAKELIKIMQDADQEVPKELEEMAERFEKHQERMNAEKEFVHDFIDGGMSGGGGGRRGGGRGGSGGGCYKCGQNGHFSRECPNGGGGGGRGGRRF